VGEAVAWRFVTVEEGVKLEVAWQAVEQMAVDAHLMAAQHIHLMEAQHIHPMAGRAAAHYSLPTEVHTNRMTVGLAEYCPEVPVAVHNHLVVRRTLQMAFLGASAEELPAFHVAVAVDLVVRHNFQMAVLEASKVELQAFRVAEEALPEAAEAGRNYSEGLGVEAAAVLEVLACLQAQEVVVLHRVRDRLDSSQTP
jgi:hypothetical protein